MTTTDAAAARRHGMMALAVLVGLASLSLAGCGGNSLPSIQSFFGSSSDGPQAAATPAVAQAPLSTVAINSIVGPPDALGRQLHGEFVSSLQRQNVRVVQSTNDGAHFNLRPYILAAKEGNGTKISYVLDVTAPSGKRVNRFAGEEVVAASPTRDPWGAITPAVSEALAAKATGAFVAWLPSAPSTGTPAVAAASSPARASAARPASARVAAASSAQTTGSIGGDLTAVVPAVRGAPGDGSTSLTAAIKRQLRTKGINVADSGSSSSYRVEGAVILGEARGGKQPIQIEWVVRDPKGKKLGTVSQKNDIPAGSLDGAWGKVADQAAGAAVQGIMKLLPNRVQG